MPRDRRAGPAAREVTSASKCRLKGGCRGDGGATARIVREGDTHNPLAPAWHRQRADMELKISSLRSNRANRKHSGERAADDGYAAGRTLALRN